MNKCSVQIVSRLDSQSKFQMFELFPGRCVPGVPRSYTNMAAPYWALHTGHCQPARPLTLQPDRLFYVLLITPHFESSGPPTSPGHFNNKNNNNNN